jgi:type IV pilus assembly protein PilC
MPEFHWQGSDREGRSVKGVITAESKTQVRDQLIQSRIRPIQIRRAWHIRWLKSNHALTDVQVTQLTRQLATLIQAGVPLFQALEVLSQTTPEPAPHALIEALQNDLSQGLHFNQALKKHAAFDALYCNLIAAAEMAGMLDSVLLQLAHHREKIQTLKRQIRAALFYPSIVLAVAVVVLSLLLMFVVPSFEQIFSSFGAQLPWLTQTVIDISHHWFSWMSALLLIAGGVRLLFKHQIQSHPKLQHRIDALWLQAPLIGRFMQQTCIARWTRTLATLFGAGIPLAQAISHLENITGNCLYQEATHRIHDQLLQGIALSQALTQHPLLFTPMLMQMCAIGEESGQLDHMLCQVATHAENEVEQTVTYLSKLVEPAIMVVLGILVGGLVMALYLPIFEMGQVV